MAAYATSGNEIYYDPSNIAARELDTQQVLTIGGTDYRYSVPDYAQRLIDKSTNNDARAC